MIVYKKFNIESARSLPNLSNEHPCSQLHGHSFEIILKISGELNEKTGFIIDLPKWYQRPWKPNKWEYVQVHMGRN